MAIDDIVRKIAEDAADEASSLIAAAEQDAAQVRDESSARAKAEASEIRARESAHAARDAGTILANARLTARDATLAARRGMAESVLERAEAALLALSDAEYAAYIARGVARTAAGGETLLPGSEDAGRLAKTLPAALEAAKAPRMTIGKGASEASHGVSLIGDRTRVEVSPAAAIAERREELLAIADGELFGAED